MTTLGFVSNSNLLYVNSSLLKNKELWADLTVEPVSEPQSYEAEQTA